jgi:CBS domain-containing protein
MHASVSAILRRKGGEVVTINPDATVFDTIARMVERNVGAIVVMNDGAPAGIFTERDYLRRIALEGRTSRTTRVEEVMTTGLVTVPPDATAEQCLALMTERRIRHLPVLDEGRIAGVVSIGDCVRTLLESTRDRAEELERFVTGGYTA